MTAGAAPLEPVVQQVEVDGGHLHVEQKGTAGTPLVLLHGFLGTRLTFSGVTDALADRRRTVTLDFRGHGASSPLPHDRRYSFDLLVEDLHRVLDRLDVARVHLLGHSMGGVIAMMYAGAHPHRIESLILADTAPAPTLPTDGLKQIADLGLTQGMEAVRRAAEAARTGPSPVPEEVTAEVLRNDPRTAADLVDELGSYTPQTTRLQALGRPVSILVGEQDALRSASETLAAALPASRLYVIAGAGHAAMWDNPDAWVAAVEDHLSKLR